MIFSKVFTTLKLNIFIIATAKYIFLNVKEDIRCELFFVTFGALSLLRYFIFYSLTCYVVCTVVKYWLGMICQNSLL